MRLEGRLGRLEDAARETAAAEVRAAWRALGDEEMALLVAPYFHKREPTPRERAAYRRYSVRYAAVALKTAAGVAQIIAFAQKL